MNWKFDIILMKHTAKTICCFLLNKEQLKRTWLNFYGWDSHMVILLEGNQTMSKCANNNCKKNPTDKLDRIFVGVDGDAVCDKYCEAEYEKQKAHFFNVTVHSADLTEKYLRGK